jgi:hypothetical protein
MIQIVHQERNQKLAPNFHQWFFPEVSAQRQANNGREKRAKSMKPTQKIDYQSKSIYSSKMDSIAFNGRCLHRGHRLLCINSVVRDIVTCFIQTIFTHFFNQRGSI